jgi:hypothetical protein
MRRGSNGVGGADPVLALGKAYDEQKVAASVSQSLMSGGAGGLDLIWQADEAEVEDHVSAVVEVDDVDANIELSDTNADSASAEASSIALHPIVKNTAASKRTQLLTKNAT